MKRKGRPVHGWVIVDKPLGLTSTQCLAKVRRLTQAAKAGHGGTLDPLASGILPIALGEATKTVAYVMGSGKTYRFTVRWGEATSTDDAEGAITFLDTPGHEDFSEDTYRTLTAVDSAVMVLDAAKGIETQTRKLFEVCRLRDVPITTFVKKATELGAVDEIVTGELLDGAIAFARKVVAEKRPLRLVRDMNDKVSNVDPAVFEEIRKANARKAKGFLAPWRCIDAVEIATKLPIDEGLLKEREFFFECMGSPQRAAQIHAFFAEREAAKIPGLPEEVKPKTIRSAAVIGAGTMGGGIAMNFANAGIPVKILEVSQEALSRGLGVIEKNYATSVARGSMKQEAMDRAMKDLHANLDWSPYEKKDPAMKRAHGGAQSGKGAFYEWDGNKEVGSGRLTITESVAPSRVTMALDMTRPFECHNIVEYTLVPQGDATLVTWAMQGPAPFIAKVMQVFFDMDKMVGRDFEAGVFSSMSRPRL